MITELRHLGGVDLNPELAFAHGSPDCGKCGDPLIGGPCYADQCMNTCGWCKPGQCDGTTCTDPAAKVSA